MQIRKANAEDFPRIQALINLFPEKLLQEHLPEPHEFTVAIEDEKIVACCALEVYSSRLAEIRSLSVESEYQGKGIATALIKACVAEARKKKIYEILTVTGSLSLFEKQGFGTFKNEKYALLKILG
jgi:amino-acid N-acetyltransferase